MAWALAVPIRLSRLPEPRNKQEKDNVKQRFFMGKTGNNL